MTFDLTRLKNVTEDQIIHAAMNTLRKEDDEARRAQKLPRKRSPQEALKFRVLFDNTYDAFLFRLAQIYSLSHLQAGEQESADLITLSPNDRFFLVAAGVDVAYSMTTVLQERSRQPVRADDIAKFCHLLAAGSDPDKKVCEQGVAACLTISMMMLTASPAGLHAGIVMREIMASPNGRIDPAICVQAAIQAGGDRHSFSAILFDRWHAGRGVLTPSRS